MGKKTRGKRRHNNKRSSQNPAASADGGQPPQQRPLLQRLRHNADRLTRHAALTALAEHPSLLLLQDSNVLAAVSERVVREPDLHCAAAAATCLGNYCLEAQDNDNNHSEEQRTAGWLVILIKRLQQSIEQMNTNNNTTTDTKKDDAATTLLLHQQVIQECLRSTVLLLETNPLAVERLVRQHAHQLFSIWTQLLQQSNNNTNTTNTTHPMIILWVCRGFHSTWDDNPALVVPFLSNNNAKEDSAKATLQALHDTIIAQQQVGGSPESSVAALHGIGAWLAAWWITLQQQPQQQQKLSPFTIPTTSRHNTTAAVVRPTTTIPTELATVLTAHAAAGVASLLYALQSLKFVVSACERLPTVYQLYQAQRADGALERAVLDRQHQTKEPARHIARRLQQQKQASQAADSRMDDGTTPTTAATPMGDNAEEAANQPNSSSNSGSGKLPADPQDAEELWDAAVTEWQAVLQPVQLALEIVANLTAGSRNTSTVGEDDDDNDEDDDDARMEDAHEPPLPEPLVAILTQTQLPDRLLSFLDQLVDHIPATTATDDGTGGLVYESLVDLLPKTAAGLCQKA